MHKSTLRETLRLGIPLALAMSLGAACSAGSGPKEAPSQAASSAAPETGATPGPKESALLRSIGAVVINGHDKRDVNVGVQTYASPNSDQVVGSYPEGEPVEVLCVAPGRTVTDRNVPEGHPATVSHKWYLLNAPEKDWMGDGYVRVDDGVAVPQCPSDVIPSAYSSPREDGSTVTNVSDVQAVNQGFGAPN